MIKLIVEGTFNSVFGLQEDMSLKRKAICYLCPLYSRKLGGVCNRKLWLNPDTNEVSTTEKEGYVHGCGCIINSKTRSSTAHCPAGKW